MKLLLLPWIILKMLLITLIVAICFFPAIPGLEFAEDEMYLYGDYDDRIDRMGWKQYPYGVYMTLTLIAVTVVGGIGLLYEAVTGRER